MSNDYNAKVTADRIKKLTYKKGMTISQLNSICDISENTIKTAGKSSDGMKAKNLFMIAETLDCSVDYLLGRADEPTAYITTGDINNSKIDNSMNVNAPVPVQDSTTQQFIQIFEELPIEDKVKIMASAIELKNKKSKITV